jgi:Fe-S-cluster-containing hydrogenase component 2
MPWVDKERCTGCGVCVESCPAGAISIEDAVAVMHMEECIRCGVCHDVCPVGCLRHESELTAGDVAANVRRVTGDMRACTEISNDPSDGKSCLGRHKNYFRRQKLVAEKTLAELEKLK